MKVPMIRNPPTAPPRACRDTEARLWLRCAETDLPEAEVKVLVYSAHLQPGNRWQFGYYSEDDGWVVEFSARQKPIAWMALPHDLPDNLSEMIK